MKKFQSLAQDGIVAHEQLRTRSASSVISLPKVAFRTAPVLIFCNTDRSRPQRWGVGLFLSLYHLFLKAVSAVIIIIIIIIIIIAFKGVIRDFLQSPHSAANCLPNVRSSGPGAIVCKSRATHRALITCKCHVTCHLVRRDSSAIKFDRIEITFS